ncbi:ABC transporter permease [Hyphomicrobiales bacterium]|nr:ABC transporter permease [Hyphomicrobiales bacterium]CAH1693812.1 ABC transporter permease [Hyphomicrobiales bacterium]
MHHSFSPLERLARGLLLAFMLVWSVTPILFIVMSSFKRQVDIFVYPPRLIFTPTIDNYFQLVVQWHGYFHAIGNSVIVALGATVLAGFISFFGGYAYSRYRSRLTAWTAVYMIAVRVLPPIVVTLPLFPVADMLGLSDTHLLLILLYAAFWVSLNTMIMKNFFDQIPYELDEAAYVDGASEWQFVTRILSRLTLQGMAAGSIFVFVYAWNEYLFAMIFTTNRAKTAPLILSELMGAVDGTEWGVLFAGVTVQLIPVVLLVTLARRYLIAGLTAGAVKG